MFHMFSCGPIYRFEGIQPISLKLQRMHNTIIKEQTNFCKMLLKIFFQALLLQVAHSLAGDDFSYNGFNGPNLSLHGLAGITSDGLLRLTNYTRHRESHAFYSVPQKFKKYPADIVLSFSTTFVFGIIPENPTLASSGFTFVLSPTNDLTTQGSPDYFLGLFNMTNNGNQSNHIFAVEFDTYNSPEARDINNNHVGIDINGYISNKSLPAGFTSDKDGKFHDLLLFSGEPMQVWIEYNGTDMQINVTLSPLWTPKPKNALLSCSVNLSSIILDHMFVGFSASTGTIYTYQYILGWSFKIDGKAPELNLSSLPPLPKTLTSLKKKAKILSLKLPIALLVFVLITAATTFVLIRKKKYSELLEDWELDFDTNRFSHEQLYKATRGFKDEYLLGIGGFGRVYRGVLPASKVEIAVKRIHHESEQGVREFVAEIVSLSKLRHRNIVQLLGYCRRKSELLLVYEFMPNGSLDNFLFSKGEQTLDWGQRFHIIKGVASGLLYLHEGCDQVVIHRDIKASNVLLDYAMNGRLGDFGLARLYDHGAAPHTTNVVGTLGFLAPELARSCKATTSSDVFAFGAFLLEVACGRRAIEPSKHDEIEEVLVDWVFENWKMGMIHETKDPRLGDNYVLEELDLRPINFFFVDVGGTLRSIDGDAEIVALGEKLRRDISVDIFVETLDSRQEETLQITLLPNSEPVVEHEVSDEDDEEVLVDVPFISNSSDEDDEREQAREKLSKYVQLKMSMQEEGDGASDNKAGDGDGGRHVDAA
ncbi:hypothetical protein J5N97_010118 [Dioscorea zingiberensis]|uniref:non-specific serine/threonine protein kinase n=1 Tax=Dioscorea zingiberensis TaxID=325984 RepID=A0A9D5D0P1_9LILI|nr:hypothetical protein J5N97_010118 [Dioscorea zingiberensis]